MTDFTCEHWRGVLAIDVFGRTDAAEHAGLVAHLEICQECRELSRELALTYDALSHVDPNALAPTDSVSPQLTSAVLGALNSAGRAHRRRRMSGVVGAAVGGLVAASLVVLAIVSVHPAATAPHQEKDVLHGSSSVTASAVLTARVWGTSVHFQEHGLSGRGVYTVSMESSSGTWWVVGTYRAEKGRTVEADMACALQLRAIAGIRVTNASGRPILTSYADPRDA